MRRGLGSYDDEELDEAPRSSERSKQPVDVSIFVHKVLKASLLCSEHGRNDYRGGELFLGKIVPWSLITWPDEKQREKFRRFQTIANPQPEVFEFAVPEWFAHKNGLI